jgi:hypothetical protein
MFIALLTIYSLTSASFRKCNLHTSIHKFTCSCSCDKSVCIGNWQKKNLPGSTPLTVQNIFDIKRKLFAVSSKPYSNEFRPSDKNLEELNT